jgi:acyl-CoA reductase-like NAD-dependent aldehyde dehydrogenase
METLLIPSADTESAVASHAELDEAIRTLQNNKDAWFEMPIERKIEYAKSIHRRTYEVANGQVAAATRAKGIPFNSAAAGEDWLAGPFIQLRITRLLIESLEQIREHGTLRIPPRRISTRPDGQLKVEVFPLSIFDRLLYMGFRGEIWMERGVTTESLGRQIGSIYRENQGGGRVSLVLGAGNVASIAPLDILHKLFTEGQVVLLKHNPVAAYLAPFMEEAFAELIADGFMRTVEGGADVGDYLCLHEGIEEIHLTGADSTHDAIVFGPGEEGAARKGRNQPRIDKRITSELGNVGPLIILPGRWSDGDLQFQAENVATQIAQNCGCNCNAARVIITHEGWSQRNAFLDRLRQVLRDLPERPAYYPGAEAHLARMIAAYPEAEKLGPGRPGMMLPTIVAGLDPANRESPAFRAEAFCSFVAETSLPGEGPGQFLTNAVRFANETLWGTLNAAIIVDPRTRRALGPELEQAIAALRYGTVTVNHWPALAYALGSPTWGAFPGHTLDDIQSGIGTVHNALLFDRPEKSVIYGPFRVIPKPPWFVTHRNASQVARRLVDLEASPGFLRLPGIVVNAIRG